jgi:hypothetical protein
MVEGGGSMLDHPGALISGLFIGLVGMGLLMYGKRAGDLRAIVVGLAMCIYPYFINDQLLLWGITFACLGGWYYAARAQA